MATRALIRSLSTALRRCPSKLWDEDQGCTGAASICAIFSQVLPGRARRSRLHSKQTLLIEIHADEGSGGWGESFAIPKIG